MTTKLKYNGYEIAFDDEKKVNLTDMWRAVDGTRSNRPTIWLDQDSQQNLLVSLSKQLNVTQNDIIEGRRGRYGGTFGHWQIALAYAKYLNPEFHIWCNQAIRSHCEEEADPGLKMDRAIEGYLKKGYSKEWAINRVYGKEIRGDFTEALKACGAEGKHYGIATGKINDVILGMSAKEYQKMLGIKQTRDGLSQAQLALIRAIEALAAERIREVGQPQPCGCLYGSWSDHIESTKSNQVVHHVL